MRKTAGMRRYRFRIIDGHNLIVEEREFPATDDHVAEQLAEGWRAGRRAELWCGERQLKRWNQRRPRNP